MPLTDNHHQIETPDTIPGYRPFSPEYDVKRLFADSRPRLFSLKARLRRIHCGHKILSGHTAGNLPLQSNHDPLAGQPHSSIFSRPQQERSQDNLQCDDSKQAKTSLIGQKRRPQDNLHCHSVYSTPHMPLQSSTFPQINHNGDLRAGRIISARHICLCDNAPNYSHYNPEDLCAGLPAHASHRPRALVSWPLVTTPLAARHICLCEALKQTPTKQKKTHLGNLRAGSTTNRLQQHHD